MRRGTAGRGRGGYSTNLPEGRGGYNRRRPVGRRMSGFVAPCRVPGDCPRPAPAWPHRGPVRPPGGESTMRFARAPLVVLARTIAACNDPEEHFGQRNCAGTYEAPQHAANCALRGLACWRDALGSIPQRRTKRMQGDCTPVRSTSLRLSRTVPIQVPPSALTLEDVRLWPATPQPARRGRSRGARATRERPLWQRASRGDDRPPSRGTRVCNRPGAASTRNETRNVTGATGDAAARHTAPVGCAAATVGLTAPCTPRWPDRRPAASARCTSAGSARCSGTRSWR